jgi:aspartyl-tRNA(Asn)/glutamyl-tRNA(Gln) amidotransferase subunit A
MKIGIPKEYIVDGISNDIMASWEQGKQWLRDNGAEIIDISLPNTKHALPVYYTIAPAEASSNLARYDGVKYGLRVVREGQSIYDMISETRAEGFGHAVNEANTVATLYYLIY